MANWHPVSFGGTTIDNGTTLVAKAFGDSFYNQAPVDPVYSAVADNYPTYSTRVIKPRDLVINIQMAAATAHTLVDTLNKIFDVTQGEQTLVVQDTDDSNEPYYINCSVVSVRVVGAVYTVKLRASIGIFRLVTPHSDATWNPTASGQTHTLSWTQGGNLPAQPTIAISPQAAKTSGRGYYRYVLMTNPSDSAWDDWWELTDGGIDTTAIIGSTARSNQINDAAGIDAVVTTIPIDTAVGGGLPGAGTGYVDTEQISWTANSGSSLTGVVRGINGTTAATHADNAVIKNSKAQADGDDFRVVVDGTEVDRKFGTGAGAFNQALTLVYARAPLQPRIEIPLRTAIAASGAITSIDLSTDRLYRDAFNRLPQAGQMVIGSEALTWTEKDVTTRQLKGTVTRACFDTSEGAHAVADTCKWLEHIIQLQYGDSSASAPTIDATRIPMWDLTSTNLSHIYTSMTDAAGLRAGRWRGDLGVPRSKGRGGTRLYSAAANTEADPATVLGIYAESWLSGSRYQDESIDANWQIVIPQGATTVTATGRKRRTSSSWPTFTFEASTDGKRWVVIWTEATPSGTSDEAWAAHSAVALGATYYYFRFHMKGGVQAGSGYYAYNELSDITFTLAAKPTITLKNETGTAYPLDMKITNNTNGEYFSIARMIQVGQTLTVQLGPKTRRCVYGKDSTVGPLIEYPSTQRAPLTLDPGVANELKVEETGLTDVDITVSAEDWIA